jgi:hypothetical protein
MVTEQLGGGRCEDCEHRKEWSENQAPYGSGLYWPEHFMVCGVAEDDLDVTGGSGLRSKDVKEWNDDWGSKIKCPFFKEDKRETEDYCGSEDE